MKIRSFFTLLLLFALAAQMFPAFAFETDQFNLPPEPLADIGFEVTNYVESVVLKSVEKVNAEIAEREKCLADPQKDCDSTKKNQEKLKFLRSDEAVAKEINKVLGSGFIPYTSSGSWLENHQFKAQPARFKPGYKQSIFVFFPTSYFELASTIKMYDAQFGTDKIAHFFREGHGYFKNYKKAIGKGLNEAQAIEKAVKSGQKTERGIYGTWISGVFSNGDLAANYVGMKFYIGLTHELNIAEKIRPAVLKLKDGVWKINEDFKMNEMLLKPFMSDHLNEALNPSGFTRMFGLSAYVRHVLHDHACIKWKETYPNLTQTDYERTTEDLRNWNGENYGWTQRKNLITIANTCFN